jgi:hypothetical protein
VTLGENEMESGEAKGDTPIGQSTRWKMAWKQVSVMVNGCQTLEYLQKIVIPARDKRKTSIQVQYSNGQASEACCPKLQQ